MDNPLEQPAPDDPIARVHTFAYDLAWGAVNGKWGTAFDVFPTTRGEEWMSLSMNIDDSQFNNYLSEKWNEAPPGSDLMQSLGYILTDIARSNENRTAYLLTQKAFALLDKPYRPPEVFISYKQSESSAFASLIEARLRIVDPDINVFIDKVLEGGDEWERRIEQAVRDCDTFICIFGQTTHESTMIPKEIAWARESGNRIIPVLHNGYRGGDNYPEELQEIQWIAVETEKAEHYELAILKLLNALGYSTLQSPRPSATAD